MARSASDLLTGRALAIGYAEMAANIETEAAEPRFRNMPLTVRRLRRYAEVARHAAVAERDDPDITDRPCSICGGEGVCIG